MHRDLNHNRNVSPQAQPPVLDAETSSHLYGPQMAQSQSTSKAKNRSICELYAMKNADVFMENPYVPPAPTRIISSDAEAFSEGACHPDFEEQFHHMKVPMDCGGRGKALAGEYGDDTMSTVNTSSIGAGDDGPQVNKLSFSDRVKTVIKQMHAAKKLEVYECNFCGYDTRKKSNMLRHFHYCRAAVGKYQKLKSKAGWMCRICDDSFKCKNAMKHHFFFKHNDMEAIRCYN